MMCIQRWSFPRNLSDFPFQNLSDFYCTRLYLQLYNQTRCITLNLYWQSIDTLNAAASEGYFLSSFFNRGIQIMDRRSVNKGLPATPSLYIQLQRQLLSLEAIYLFPLLSLLVCHCVLEYWHTSTWIPFPFLSHPCCWLSFAPLQFKILSFVPTLSFFLSPTHSFIICRPPSLPPSFLRSPPFQFLLCFLAGKEVTGDVSRVSLHPLAPKRSQMELNRLLSFPRTLRLISVARRWRIEALCSACTRAHTHTHAWVRYASILTF